MTMPAAPANPAGDPALPDPPPAPPPDPEGLTVPVPPPPAPPAGELLPRTAEEYEAALEEARKAARQEEKNKVYGRNKELRDQVQELTSWKQQQEEAVEEARKQAEAEAEARRQAELTAQQRLEEQQEVMRQEIEALRLAQEQERAVFEQERRLQELEAFRQRRIQEEATEILPQLQDLVRGASPEEIEASIQDMKARTAAAVTELQEEIGTRRRPPVLPATGGPSFSHEELTGQGRSQTFTPKEIREMSPEVYAQHRDQLRSALSQRVAERGVYAG